MKYLLVANQTLGGQRLRGKLHELSAPDTTVHLVVPATSADVMRQPLKSDVMDHPLKDVGGVKTGSVSAEARNGRARAQHRLREGLGLLSQEGIVATGEVGSSDPLEAIADALAGGQYDEIIVSTLPRTVSRWLRMDLPRRARRKFHLPVTHIEASA